jgi:peptide chain release factor 1
MALLRAKLYDQELERVQSAQAAERRSMVGSGDRSEKIRTYNYPQSRVTDHRIGYTMHNLVSFMDGNIDELLDELSTQDEAERLQHAGV